MKATASKANTASRRQGQRSPAKSGASAEGARRKSTAADTASTRATTRARRGEPLKVERKSDRSPKQENL